MSRIERHAYLPFCPPSAPAACPIVFADRVIEKTKLCEVRGLGHHRGMNRPLSIALVAVILEALLGGACGSSSTSKPDGSGGSGGSRSVASDGGGDLTATSYLVGTIDPTLPPECITAPLLLVGGQAQCTIIQHRTATGGVIDTALLSCDTVSQGPCWSLVTSPSSCPAGGLTFTFDPDPANPNPNPSTLSYDYTCQLRSN
jgi:hypothetical protein